MGDHTMGEHAAEQASSGARLWARRVGRVISWAGLAMLGGVIYTGGIEPTWVDVCLVPLSLPRLAPAFAGYRIAQLSDLHLGDWLDRARLERVVALVNEQRPDLVAITGDFVTRRPEAHAADLAAALGQLRARDGVVFVFGNHDYRGNIGVLRAALRAVGMRELSNTTHTIERDGAQLHVAGVDDVWRGRARLDEVLARLPLEGAAILLAHEPDFADIAAASGRFDLQLSGHTHGGQISLPLVGPPRLPPFGRRYPSGRYQVGTMIHYTNRGIGMVRPFVRFNCRPEITVFALACPAPDLSASRRSTKVEDKEHATWTIPPRS